MVQIDRETIRSFASARGLHLSTEEDLDALVAVVEGNEATFRPVDEMPLGPAESPFAFPRRRGPRGSHVGR